MPPQGNPGVEFTESTTVAGVRNTGDISQVVLDITAGIFAAGLVAGADGVYSVTRRFVARGHPDASHAGYTVRRGLVSEAEVPVGLGNRGSSGWCATASCSSATPGMSPPR